MDGAIPFADHGLTIEAIETVLLDIPITRPHHLSMATIKTQAIVVVRIRCSDGIIGLGECTTIGGLSYGAESPEGMKLTIDNYIAPILVGRTAPSPQALMMKVCALVKGNNFAKCGVEVALFDAWARRIGVSLSTLLGGRKRERVPVTWTLASGDTARDIEEAQRMLDLRRHNMFKLKIGLRSIAEDVAHVAKVKRAVGEASVRADVNMAWSECEAMRALPALADAGCELAEQPVSSVAAMARLVRRYPIALMADESLHGPESAFELARQAAVDVFSIKIEPSGGLTGALKVAAIAEAAGIGIYGGTMLEGGIGTIAAAHLFSSFSRLEWGTELFGPLLLSEEILTQSLEYHDFALTVPGGSGLGIDLDEDRISFYRRDSARSLISLPS